MGAGSQQPVMTFDPQSSSIIAETQSTDGRLEGAELPNDTCSGNTEQRWAILDWPQKKHPQRIANTRTIFVINI